MSQESIEGCEARVLEMHEKSKNFYIMQPVADATVMSGKDMSKNDNKAKLNGAFKLLINHKLPMHKKIERYGTEPVVFYLHKQRNFIRKLE
jgi:hypothetical protein